MIVVLTTAPPDLALRLADSIVKSRLAACVQILPPMTSVYVWEGDLQNESENLLLIKTLPEKYLELEQFITENHPYEVPEIVAIEASNVSTPYLAWLGQTVNGVD